MTTQPTIEQQIADRFTREAAGHRLADLLGDGPARALVAELHATAYRQAADALSAGNPGRTPEFTEGVDWAVDTLRSAADKTAGEGR